MREAKVKVICIFFHAHFKIKIKLQKSEQIKQNIYLKRDANKEVSANFQILHSKLNRLKKKLILMN